MSWSTRYLYQGKRVNGGTLAIMTAANILVRSKKFGSERENITMLQGGYNKGGVAASAGTHDGGGAFDITAYNIKNRVTVFRLLGVAIWYRPTRAYVWSAHIHGIVAGDGTASSGAKYQVNEYLHGGDGLVGSAKDTAWRPASLPIYFHLPTKGQLGYAYVKKASIYRNQPSIRGTNHGTAKIDVKFDIVAIVKDSSKTYWAVDPSGTFFPWASLTKTKPKPKPVVTKKKEQFVVIAGAKGSKYSHKTPNSTINTPRASGYILTVAGHQTISGKIWYVTAYGNWYTGSQMARYTATKLTYTVTAKPSLLGLQAPGSGNVQKASLKTGSKIYGVGVATVDGQVWVRDSKGLWWSAKYLK